MTKIETKEKSNVCIDGGKYWEQMNAEYLNSPVYKLREHIQTVFTFLPITTIEAFTNTLSVINNSFRLKEDF